MVKKAAQISFEAHKKDFDKNDYPYFMHPMALAMQFDDEESVCVALLHDVIEDHGDRYTFKFLEEKGFSQSIIKALKLLTHQKGIDYIDYIKIIKTNDLARRVKIADLKHNLDLTRCNGKKPPKYEIYQHALRVLGGENIPPKVSNEMMETALEAISDYYKENKDE